MENPEMIPKYIIPVWLMRSSSLPDGTLLKLQNKDTREINEYRVTDCRVYPPAQR